MICQLALRLPSPPLANRTVRAQDARRRPGPTRRHSLHGRPRDPLCARGCGITTCARRVFRLRAQAGVAAGGAATVADVAPRRVRAASAHAAVKHCAAHACGQREPCSAFALSRYGHGCCA
ncbi:hypothetical protein PsYK624_089900 [Phanerochaete sordida]|uniref:Uncharacterized protein n=1 Tax=Phanerochaete sordida TaxID=48140 RepID=A0A9P3LG89_9APHY|nr:hypothetical protein PsYK624_089900 [Phanerochaete sordida]